MNLNDLHLKARSGDKSAENDLFEFLSARFRLVARHRIWNKNDAEEVVQDSLSTVTQKYKSIEVETSFAAWAQKVLDLNILGYIGKKTRQSKYFEPLPEGDFHSPSENPDPSLRLKLLDCLRKVSHVNRRHARILVFIYQGFGVEDVCQKLKLTVNNYYSVLSRARSMLGMCLEKGEVK